MNQRDATALPRADLDPGSGSAVILPFRPRAATRPAPTRESLPISVQTSVQHAIDSIHALRQASAELAAALEAMSANARALERSCRSLDEKAKAIGAYGGRIADTGGALTASIKRFQ